MDCFLGLKRIFTGNCTKGRAIIAPGLIDRN